MEVVYRKLKKVVWRSEQPGRAIAKQPISSDSFSFFLLIIWINTSTRMKQDQVLLKDTSQQIGNETFVALEDETDTFIYAS